MFRQANDTMNQMAIGGLCAFALAATACVGSSGVSMSTTSPSPAVPPARLTTATAPGIEGAVMQAVAHCHGDVFDVLRAIFGNSPLVNISDNPGALTFGVSSQGHTSTHTITYVDNDLSSSLTCGDTVTSVT